MGQLSSECNVKIDYLSLKNIGYRIRIRHNTLYHTSFVLEGNLRNDSGKGIIKKLDDFLGRILFIVNKDMPALALLSTT